MSRTHAFDDPVAELRSEAEKWNRRLAKEHLKVINVAETPRKPRKCHKHKQAG